MQDTPKTNTKLIDEMRELRRRNTELEATGSHLKETNKLLKEGEERFRTIANYAYDWENWVGLDGELLWVNQAVEKLTGYSPEEYIHLPDRLKHIVWDGDQERIFSHFKNALKKQQSGNDVEFRIRCKNGSLKWVSISYQPMYTERGECLGFRSSIRDISMRKLAEQALLESKERFKTVAESSCDAILISNQKGTIIFWNTAASKMFGYDEGEIAGESYTKLLPERLRERDQQAWQQFFKTGMLLKDKKPFETVALRKDGSEFPIELTFSFWGIKDEQYFSFIIRDISERKQQEDALKDREERFRSIVESSFDGICIIAQNGTVDFWNNAAKKIFGYDEKEVLGKSYTMLIPERLRDWGYTMRQNFLKTGVLTYHQKPFETMALRKSGSEFPVEATFSNWYLKGQHFLSIVIRDITERKQQEALLKMSEERFRSVAESSIDAIYISDQNGTIMFWNRAAAKIFGYQESEVLGQSQTILLPKRLFKIHSEARDKIIQQKLVSFMSKPIETVAVKKDGTEFPVELTVSNWKIEDNYYFNAIVRDISERKKAKEALEKSEARYRELVKNSKNAIAIYEAIDDGRDFIFKEFNHAAETIEHIKKEALIGKRVTEVFPGVKEFDLLEVFRRVWKTGKPEEYPVSFYHDDRISGWKENYVYKLPSGEIVVVYEDVTERKQMEEQLRKSHDELEQKVQQRTFELAKANKELQNSQTYLKKFSGRLLSIREEERKNISTTLHDELGTMALSVTSKISIAREECKENNKQATFKALEQAQAALRKAIEDLRRLAVDLRPPNLEIVGLTAAATDLIDKAKEQAKLKIIFRNELGNKNIAEDKAIAIYRVIQEALTNITIHAKAKNVRVKLYAEKRNIHLDITDDGVGCDFKKLFSKRGKLKIGIGGMRERIESLRGEFIITSAPKRGTQIKATLPKK